MTFGNIKFTGFLSAATGVVLAECAFIISDIVLAGRVLGEAALGSFALLIPTFSAISFCIGLIAVGTATACSEALGRLERDRANVLAGQGLLTAVAVGVALALAVSQLLDPYLELMAPGSATAETAKAFGRWMPLVIVIVSIDLFLVNVVYVYGGEKDCVISCIVQILLNMLVSYGLGAGLWGLPSLGISGIAVGTLVACMIGVLLLVPAVLRRRGGLRFVLRWEPESLLVTVKASIGEVSSGFFHTLLFVAIAKFVIVRYGVDSLPVATVVFCIIMLTVCFRGTGLALRKIEPLYHGEGNRLAVKRLVRFAAFVSLSESVLLMGVILIAPELIVSIFDIADPELSAATIRAIRLTVIGLTGYAMTYPICVHYSCTGSPMRSVVLSALAFFGVPTALLFTFGAIYGMDGVCLAVAVGPLVPLAAFLLVFRRRMSGPAACMWSISLNCSEDVALVLAAVRDALQGTCSDNSLKRMTDVLMLALKRLHERNGESSCRVEISLLFGKENVELILRDDGVHEALDDLGLPVVHVPAGSFNRNVFTVPLGGASKSLSTRKKGGRYVVLRGQDVPPEDIEAVIALDRESFAEAYQVAPEQDILLFKANRENGLVIKDSKTGAVVAYSMLLPVRDEIYDRILTGRFIDTALTPDMVHTFDRPGIYRMYFASIVIHPAHRGASLLLTMFDAMVADFIELAERGIFGASLAADVVSPDGEKFAKLFGLTEIRKTNHASRIFEVRGLPPEFRVTTPATERLVGLYWEKFVQEKLKK